MDVPQFPAKGAQWVDVDGDGQQDLFLYGDVEAGANHLIMNNNGEFSVASAPELEEYGDLAAWADMDNDGLLDVILRDSPVGPFRILHNLGGQDFDPVPVPPYLDQPYVIVSFVDINGDGYQDIFAAKTGEYACYVFRNLGGSGFATPISVTGSSPLQITAAKWADFDSDGDVDLYVACTDENHLFRNDGQLPLVDCTPPILGDIGGTDDFVWCDYDSDNQLDLIDVSVDRGPRVFHNNVTSWSSLESRSGMGGTPRL